MSMNLLETVYCETRSIRNVAFEMRALARAFATTGNRQIAEDLLDLAMSIEKSAEAITVSYGQSLTALVREQEENFHQTVVNTLELLGRTAASSGSTPRYEHERLPPRCE